MTIGTRIKHRREAVRMTQTDLGRLCGVTKQTIFKYENGIISNIPMDKIELISKALNVTPAYLMGWDHDQSLDPLTIPGIIPMPETRKIPLLGTIACGTPILAAENLDGEVDIPKSIHADFALICRGDSMIGARIYDGDVVYIRQQPTVENGEIAAILIEDAATLKRVYLYPDQLILNAENPAYAPMIYLGTDRDAIRILGKTVGFTSKRV